jgi:hypothetical protein
MMEKKKEKSLKKIKIMMQGNIETNRQQKLKTKIGILRGGVNQYYEIFYHF